MGSGILIKKAILKYGVNSFVKELLDSAETHNELIQKERSFIHSEIQNGRGEYNIHNETPSAVDENLIKQAVDLYTNKLMKAEDIGIILGLSKPRIIELGSRSRGH